MKKSLRRKAIRIPFAWFENKKKTFEEDGAEAPMLLGGGIHLWMRAFPSACHRLSAPILWNRPSSSKEKKTSKSLEVEKSLRQKKMLVEKLDEKREPDGVFPLSRGIEGVLFLGSALFSASKD